jgi:hypothetical protein
MKYIVTESQYKKLNEEVGVPTNIVEIAQKLFDKIMSKLKPNVNLGMFFHKPITLKGDFQINDYKFNTIQLIFNVESLDDYNVDANSIKKVHLLGMTQLSSVEMTKDFNYTYNRKMNKIDLSIINPGFVATDLTAKNNFKMPFLISANKASDYIFQGLEKKDFEIHFPKKFTFFMKFLRHLPNKFYLKFINYVYKKDK